MLENFEPCKSNTFSIFVDRFGAESETITITSDDPDIPPKTASGGSLHGGSAYSFDDKKQEGMFQFAMDLKNGQENAADQAFTASNERVDIEFILKLIHTPGE